MVQVFVSWLRGQGWSVDTEVSWANESQGAEPTVGREAKASRPLLGSTSTLSTDSYSGR